MAPWYTAVVIVFVVSALYLNEFHTTFTPRLQHFSPLNKEAAHAECRSGPPGIYDNGNFTTQYVNRTIPMTDVMQTDLLAERSSYRTGEQIVLRVVSRDINGTRTCEEGDMFEITAESPLELVGIKVRSTGHGTYTALFSPRRRGGYMLCLRLYYTSRLQGVPRLTNGTYLPYHWAGYSSMHMTNHSALGHPNTWCSGTKPDLQPKCINITVEGDDKLPVDVCSPDNHRTAGSGIDGSWLYTPPPYTCAPGFCEGDLPFMNIDGWIFVPYACYLRFFNRDSGWDCLQDQKLVFFGDSTLRQTASNLLENLLGTPVLGDKSYKWAKAHCTPHAINMGRSKKCYSAKCMGKALMRRYCPDLNTLRKWSGVRQSPYDANTSFTGQFVWGGGVKRYTKWGIRPSAFDHFWKNRHGYGCSRSFCTQARAEFAMGLAGSPDHVILNGFLWDLDVGEWDRFYDKVKNTLAMIKQYAPNATVHWNLAHPQCVHSVRDFKDRDELSHLCWRTVNQKAQTVAADHNNMLLLESFKRDFPEVRVTDRYNVILGHNNGHRYCHQAMHYGASETDCLLFSLSSDSRETCARNWRVDKMLVQLLLNGICPSTTPLSTPYSSLHPNITIDSGVPKSVGNWLGIPGAPDPES